MTQEMQQSQQKNVSEQEQNKTEPLSTPSEDEQQPVSETDTDLTFSEIASDPANFNTVLIILLNRIYDAQMAFLATVNPEKADQLHQLHEQGMSLAPPPAILVD